MDGAPTQRRVTATLVSVEALVLLAAGIFLGVETVVATATQFGGAVALTVLTLAMGAALAVCARAVLHGRRWVKGPVLTWQLVQAGLAMPLSASERWYLGVPLLALCVVVGVLVAGDRVVPAAREP